MLAGVAQKMELVRTQTLVALCADLLQQTIHATANLPHPDSLLLLEALVATDAPAIVPGHDRQEGKSQRDTHRVRQQKQVLIVGVGLDQGEHSTNGEDTHPDEESIR